MGMSRDIEKINKSNLKLFEYWKVCKEELLKREDFSNLVREIIENDCINLNEVSGYYWLTDGILFFESLDKYLKCNVEDLETYEFSTKIFLDGEKYDKDKNPTNAYYYYNHPVIPISYFNSYIYNPYNVFTDGYPGDLHFVLKKSVRVIDALNDDIGTICIHVKPSEFDGERGFVIEKESIKNGMFIEERYQENSYSGSVSFHVYDLKKALDRKAIDPFKGVPAEDTLINPFPAKRDRDGIMGARKPWFIGRNDLVFSGLVHKIRDSKENKQFGVEYYEGNVRFNENLIGDSLYSAYLDFMIEKGYLDKSQKEMNKNLK